MSPDALASPSPTLSAKRPRADDDDDAGDDVDSQGKPIEKDLSMQPPPLKKFSRLIQLATPDSYYYDPYDRSTHNAEHAAKMRALDIAKAGGPDAPGAASFAAPTTKYKPGDVVIRPSSSFASGFRATPTNNNNTTTTTTNTTTTAPASAASAPAPLGQLSSTPDSFDYPLEVVLHDRETSWGRGSTTTIRYPDLYEVRIPKYAFQIIFWSPALAAHLDQRRDWRTLPGGCHAMIKTQTKQIIWVNGVRLVAEAVVDGKTHWGKVYSGDVVTVCRPDGDRKGIEFVCKFFHGPSANARPDTEEGFKLDVAIPEDETDLAGVQNASA
jgi:hypothetical protein